jgi:DNA-binding transcriptional LysR family regulator
MMNLYQLELFAAVVANGNLTRTAESLHLSQPALTSRIRALEESLGEPLFEQVGRRMCLTEAGRELYDHAELILREVAEAKRAVAEVRALERGSLRLVATTTVGTYVLPRILGTFHRAHPGVTLQLDVTNEVRSIEAIRRHSADLAVLGPVEESEDVVVEDFMPNVLFFAATPDHPLAHQSQITLAELVRHAILVREEGSGTRAVLTRIFAEHDLKPTIAMELRHSAAIKQGIIAGLGLGLLSVHETEVERRSGALVALEIDGLQINHDWHIMHLRRQRLSHVSAAFKELLLSYAAQYGGKPQRSPSLGMARAV